MSNGELPFSTSHRVRVEDLPEKGLDVHFSDPKGEWNQYFREIPALEFTVKEAVEAAIRLSPVGRAVQVMGWVHTELDLRCCRCLRDFSYPLTSQIDVTLFPDEDEVREEEIELESSDLKAGFFSGDEVDLSGLIREQILLGIPYKALCLEKCKGLCSQCGINLNEGNCGCERKVGDSAFKVLKGLQIKGK